MSYNNDTIYGRLVALPSFYSAPQPERDRAWARLAVTCKGKTDFVSFSTFGKNARDLVKQGSKGKKILIHGKLYTSSKIRADGTYNNYSELCVDRISFDIPDWGPRPVVSNPFKDRVSVVPINWNTD